MGVGALDAAGMSCRNRGNLLRDIASAAVLDFPARCTAWKVKFPK